MIWYDNTYFTETQSGKSTNFVKTKLILDNGDLYWATYHGNITYHLGTYDMSDIFGVIEKCNKCGIWETVGKKYFVPA